MRLQNSLDDWIKVVGVVQPGHRVASGLASDSPYPAGTIALQSPHFRERGLDLSGYFAGTLNVSIGPIMFALIAPEFTFRGVNWIAGFDSEDFSFSRCVLFFADCQYSSLVYYPHPETKLNHFQDPSTIEILAPKIPGITYGDRVSIGLNPQEIQLKGV